MRLWLYLSLVTWSCNASCVWLRTMGDKGLAWCVDEVEEGHFVYELKAGERERRNAAELHRYINKQYNSRRRDGQSSIGDNVAELLPSNQPQNWTMYDFDIFGNGLPSVVGSAASVISAASSAVSNAVDYGLRSLRGGEDEMPSSHCYVWEGESGDQCVLRISRLETKMSQAQVLAISNEVEMTCKALGMDWAYRQLDVETSERKCLMECGERPGNRCW